MAFRYGLFDSTEIVKSAGGFPVGNKAQTADFFARYFAAFVGNGILRRGGGFALSAGDGLRVVIAPGEAFLNGYFCFDDEETEHTFDYSGVENEYWLVLRLDTNRGEIRLIWLVASQAVNLPIRTGGLFDLVLAHLTIPGGCEQITDEMIEDLREEDACGFVSSLAYSDAARLAAPFTLGLHGGCEGEAELDGSGDVTLAVNRVNADYIDAGVLGVAFGGTGATDAEAARLNLGAASLDHTTLPADLEDGALGAGVVAAGGVDEACRLRNIALVQALPESLPDGSLCAVYGEEGRGLYAFVGGAAVKIAAAV